MCWFHNNQLNQPYGLDDCEVPKQQALAGATFGTTFTRLGQKHIELIPAADKATCYGAGD